MPSITKQPTEPNSGIDIDTLRTHLGLFDDDSLDPYLSFLLLSAEKTASDYLQWPIGATSFQQKTSSFVNTKIKQNVSLELVEFEIIYSDETGLELELAKDSYSIENIGGYLQIKFNGDLPELSSDLELPVQFNYIQRLNPALRTNQMQQAIMLYVGDMYDNRSNISQRDLNRTSAATLALLNKISPTSQRLLDSIAEASL